MPRTQRRNVELIMQKYAITSKAIQQLADASAILHITKVSALEIAIDMLYTYVKTDRKPSPLVKRGDPLP